MSASPVAPQSNFLKYERDTATFQKIVDAIRSNLSEFQKPGVLFVRPGYKETAGWVTDTPAIVALVAKKRDVTPDDQLPPAIDGFDVDVRQATYLERVRAEDPGRYAELAANAPGEFQVAQPQFEYAPNTGAVTATVLDEVLTSRPTKPQIPYTPAAQPLAVIEAPMSILCHVSPDAGWTQLRNFLGSVRSKLVVGMYDFTSAHILQEIETSFRASAAALTLTLDDPSAENPSANQPDTQTVSDLQSTLGKNFDEAWALVRSSRMAQEWIFPSAYHIKVAVADGARVWLSSGNWNNSNQPDIDPWKDRARADEVAKDSDRDWHVIVESPELAKLFEAYLRQDFSSASQAAGAAVVSAAEAEDAAALTTAEVLAMDAEMRVAAAAPVTYFEPLRVPGTGTMTLKIQPLLTPDPGCYVDHVLQMIQSTQKSLYIQLQYIHPSDKDADQKFAELINAVIEVQRARKDVRIIVSQWQAMNGWLDRLQQSGINMQSVRIQHGVHNKGFVVDSNTVMLGSQNWSGDGALRNRDASLIIYDQPSIAKYYEQIFLHDWENLAHQTSVMSPQAVAAQVDMGAAPMAIFGVGLAPAFLRAGPGQGTKKARFVMANRRAGKFGDARLVSRQSLEATLLSIDPGIDVLADNLPKDPYARRVVVFEADPAEVQAKLIDPNVLIEPEILHWPDVVPPADLIAAQRISADIMASMPNLGPSSSFPQMVGTEMTVVVQGGGAPLNGATVLLYASNSGLPQPIPKLTGLDGTAVFSLPMGSMPSALVVIPAGGFWTMVKRGPSFNERIECPALPASGPLGWWHGLLGQTAFDLNAGKAIKVGVIDTGCGPHPCLTHARLIGAFTDGSTLPPAGAADVDSHGTHVCGLIGGRPAAAGHYGGIAPGVDLLVARVFPAAGKPANQADIANAIDALSRDQSVDLINMSLGSTQASQIEHDSIVDAYERGTVCVCAAGNNASAVNWPGAFPECIAVSALGQLGWGPDGTLASTRTPTSSTFLGSRNFYFANFSSFGQQVLCAGPGVGVISTVPARFGLVSPFLAMDGTSMASPAVCGAFAVLLAASAAYAKAPRGKGRSDLARQLLRDSCKDIGLPLQYQGLGVPLIS
jgi:Subtilase family/PLD-like domain